MIILIWSIFTGGHDFEPHTIVVQFPADEDSPISDLPVSVPIIDDAVNEAPEEHFVVRLDTTEGTSSLVEVGEQQVSLCTIVDNDCKSFIIMYDVT